MHAGVLWELDTSLSQRPDTAPGGFGTKANFRQQYAHAVWAIIVCPKTRAQIRKLAGIRKNVRCYDCGNLSPSPGQKVYRLRFYGQHISWRDMWLPENVAKKLPLIGVAIVASIDVIQHFSKPEADREWNALFAALFVDIGAVIIGGIVGGILAGIALWVAGLFVAVASAPLLVIGVGIAAGIAVSVALTSLADHYKLEAKVKEALDGFAAGPESFAEKLADYIEGAVEAVDDFLNEANPGDGRITGPTDYIMEVHTGLDRYIGWKF